MSEWISVKDSLPKPDDCVLWLFDNGYIYMDCLDHDMDDESIGLFLKGTNQNGPVKYWMPLPSPPRG